MAEANPILCGHRICQGNFAMGLMSQVYHAAIKVPWPHEYESHRIECEIYRRLGQHPRITTVFVAADGEHKFLVLEKMDINFRQALYEFKQMPSDLQIVKWAKQAAEAFEYIHGKGVLQRDVGAHNCLLDKDLNLKICDFGGSSLDGSEPLAAAGVRASAPWLTYKDPETLETEIYAIGCLFYEMCTTREVYHDKTYEEIWALLKDYRLPATDHLILHEIIQGCWNRRYASVTEIRAQLDLLRPVEPEERAWMEVVGWIKTVRWTEFAGWGTAVTVATCLALGALRMRSKLGHTLNW